MIHAEFTASTTLPTTSLARRRSDVLSGALALLSSDPDAWCQGSGARDAAGNRVSSRDPAACAWCIMGAIERAAGDDIEASEAADELAHGLVQTSLSAINDDRSTTHEEVVGLMWKASLTSLMIGTA